MAVVYVCLRDIPAEVRMSAIHAALKAWVGEPADIVKAALYPSDAAYPVSRDLYEQEASRWKAAA